MTTELRSFAPLPHFLPHLPPSQPRLKHTHFVSSFLFRSLYRVVFLCVSRRLLFGFASRDVSFAVDLVIK